MKHPDFRVGGRIFATLGYPGTEWGMVKLFPDQQQHFCQSDPRGFVPVKGAWGRSGCTNVLLPAAQGPLVREALAAAFENAQSAPTRKARTRSTPPIPRRKP